MELCHMQNLEIISVNLWQILISLCNLLIMFLLLKKFLYQPVKKAMAERQAAVDRQYAEADEAKRAADEDKAAWAQQMSEADEKAAAILQQAKDAAERQSARITDEAREKAAAIVRQAESDAALEMKKAESTMRQEIVDVSALMTAKLLQREVKADDHRALIDEFIDEIGSDDV